MAEPVSQVSTQAIRQLAQLAQMASNPLTVVKHGRREDRQARRRHELVDVVGEDGEPDWFERA
ncbi:hypothetical protein [Streptomyces sp. NPDC001292]|uniref:hypothetical protein n=1 Tax=Streptomyces sp. NPDC001292 TaxID=3364558 RepID=UPI0036CA37C2